MAILTAEARALIESDALAHLVTLNPDGSPQRRARPPRRVVGRRARTPTSWVSVNTSWCMTARACRRGAPPRCYRNSRTSTWVQRRCSRRLGSTPPATCYAPRPSALAASDRGQATNTDNTAGVPEAK